MTFGIAIPEVLRSAGAVTDQGSSRRGRAAFAARLTSEGSIR
jgi:hypothetical protein